MDNQNKILRKLEVIERLCADIRTIVGSKKQRGPNISIAKPVEDAGPPPEMSDAWPHAVPDYLIIGDDASARRERAAQIALSLPEMHAKRVLDFGAAHGDLCVELSAQNPAVIMGYDIAYDTELVTSDFNKIREAGTFDVIIMFDVIDHARDPVEALKKARSVIDPVEGRLYMRTHPWTSRHGAHYYEKVNKAYLHLAYTDGELHRMYNLESSDVLRLNHPNAAYENMIRASGFKIMGKQVHTVAPEEMFLSGPIFDRIKLLTWGGKMKDEAAHKILKIQFIDFILTPI